MSDPLVVIDADVLGRRRTGDETYVLNLLRELPPLAGAAGLRIAAVTRRPDLVPAGVEPIELAGRLQELRMAWALPRLLRRLGAALVQTQYAVPLRCPCPSVVMIHDLSFELDPTVMSRRDRAVFRWAVPRAAHSSARILTVSERSKRDIVELYGIAPAKVVVTPNGVDRIFAPGPGGPRDYVLAVGAVLSRKNQIAALSRRRRSACRSSSSGRRRIRRPPARCGRRVRPCAGTSRSKSSSRCTPVQPASFRHPTSRGSACPFSRRWPAACRS